MVTHTPWKVCRYGSRPTHWKTKEELIDSKFITIYPGRDSEDIEPDGYNFHTTFALLREINNAILEMELSLDTANVSPSDIGVGDTNRLSVRFWDWNSMDYRSPSEIPPDEWQDDRKRSFYDNLPDPRLLERIMEVADEYGVEI